MKKILEDFEPKATPKNKEAMKKEYMKPTMKVVKIQHQSHILVDSVHNLNSGDTGLKLGGAGNGDARARSFDGFDDWDE